MSLKYFYIFRMEQYIWVIQISVIDKSAQVKQLQRHLDLNDWKVYVAWGTNPTVDKIALLT